MAAYDVIEAPVTKRQKSVLKRALELFKDRLKKAPKTYKKKHSIKSEETVKRHRKDADVLLELFNL